MNPKTTLLLPLLILLIILAGCSSEETKCAEVGEAIGAANMPEECCTGLKPVGGFKGGYEGDCSLPALPTGLSICSPCGNGICDIENSENKCNCPSDCTSGSEKIEINRMSIYYKELTKECPQKGGYGCCIASVRQMENGNHKLSENNTCEDGFRLNMLKCIDSYKWCEPMKP